MIKGIEYHHKFQEGALPGEFYHYAEVTAPGANLYYTVYFLATGLHAFHVIVGMSILIWILARVLRGHFSPTYYVPVELGGPLLAPRRPGLDLPLPAALSDLA